MVTNPMPMYLFDAQPATRTLGIFPTWSTVDVVIMPLKQSLWPFGHEVLFVDGAGGNSQGIL